MAHTVTGKKVGKNIEFKCNHPNCGYLRVVFADDRSDLVEKGNFPQVNHSSGYVEGGPAAGTVSLTVNPSTT